MGRLTEMMDMVVNGPDSKHADGYAYISPSKQNRDQAKEIREDLGIKNTPKISNTGLTCKMEPDEFKIALANAGPAPVSIPDKVARDKWLSEREGASKGNSVKESQKSR